MKIAVEPVEMRRGASKRKPYKTLSPKRFKNPNHITDVHITDSGEKPPLPFKWVHLFQIYEKMWDLDSIE